LIAFIPHNPVERAIRGVEQRCFAGDFDRLGHCPRLQAQILLHIASHFEDHRIAFRLLEARGLRRYGVGSGVEIGCSIFAGMVRDHGSGNAGCDVNDCNFRIGNHCPGGIADCPQNPALISLCGKQSDIGQNGEQQPDGCAGSHVRTPWIAILQRNCAGFPGAIAGNAL
jgi:hypothetical protein